MISAEFNGGSYAAIKVPNKIYNPCENIHVHVNLITLTVKTLDFEINFENESFIKFEMSLQR